MIDRSSLRLGAGVLASLILHALGALGLGLAPADWRQRPTAREADPPRIRPGIERSRSATINWLGFETPTPHQAPMSPIDQPQLALDPGAAAGASPSPAVEADAPPAPESPASAEDALAATPRSAANPLEARPNMGPAEVFVGPPAPPEPATSAAEGANAAKERTQQGASPTGEPASDAGKEADASARTEPIEVVPGRPAAAEGVDIATIRPRWTLYTRMTASPRNPVIEAHFDRTGRVVHARMIQGSGRADVDGPLMDAVYNWRAKGEAIDALSMRNAHSTRLILRFRIGLR